MQIAARGISCVVYGKSLLEKIRSSCSSLSATEKPLQRSSAYFLYVDNCSASTSFFLQLTVPPDSNEDSNVNAVKKSVAVTMFSSSPEKYFSLRSSQSLRSWKSSMANMAVTNSKTVKETPPVLTFSKT